MTNTPPSSTPLAPGARIGILGGGQLGRMLAVAAAELGFNCHIYCPEENPPAGEVAASTTCAAYEDESALTRFAEKSLQRHENIAALPFPLQSVHRGIERVTRRPRVWIERIDFSIQPHLKTHFLD